MAGRHRPGKHNEKTINIKEFYKVLPVKPHSAPVTKKVKLTPSDTDTKLQRN